MTTFKGLYDFIQTKKSDKLQIYSNRRQVNVLNADDLSICNIVFDDDEVHVYACDRPGIADYGTYYERKLTDTIEGHLCMNNLAIEAQYILADIT